MISFKKLVFISALLLGSAMLSANATPVLSFVPTAQSVLLGNQAIVDVVLSGLEAGGLDEILSAYDISFTYDDSILGYASGTFYDLVDIAPVPVISGGVVSWNSASFASDATLQASQGDSLTLATLVFNTLSTGTSPLTFTHDDLTGLNASALDHTVSNGSITVYEPTTMVPEPTTMMLMGLGFLGMTAARGRKAGRVGTCFSCPRVMLPKMVGKKALPTLLWEVR